MRMRRCWRTLVAGSALAAGLLPNPASAMDNLASGPTNDREHQLAEQIVLVEEPVAIPIDSYVTGPVANWLAQDYPTQNEELPPVCRWEQTKAGSRLMMYVKIEDGRTATNRLIMVGYVFTDDGDEARPVVFRPGAEDFVIDITGHWGNLEIGAMAASDREGYHSNFAIMSDCTLVGPEPYNQFFS